MKKKKIDYNQKIVEFVHCATDRYLLNNNPSCSYIYGLPTVGCLGIYYQVKD